MSDKLTRFIININGIVQGVGFRPFVYNLARTCRINGWVNNFPGGVHIDAEGTEESVKNFIRRLREDAPPLSSIDTFHVESAATLGYSDFEIKESSSESTHEAYISGDVSVCEDCLAEMNNPNNRRYRYPFINCTNCGPRFTITNGIPYDRINTTMSTFPMCEECAKEYHNPSDRRFHAQPIACSKCGPSLSLLDSSGKRVSQGNEIEKAIEFLNEGRIIAIKGLGGYHLACDAKNGQAVLELRKRKHRDGKPFALMAKNIEVVLEYCFVTKKEAEILQDVKKPIVLLHRKSDFNLAVDYISPDNDKIGIMLPYTPLHHLLFTGNIELLVMTSGNRSGEPIYYKDDEVIRGLGGIADYFLVNNRDIFIRTDDSVSGIFRDKECIIRRSRGYVPFPIDISSTLKALEYPLDRIPSVLACGGELKNTYCLTKGSKAFISHHIGDLENIETLMSFEAGIRHFKRIFSVAPELVAFDKHPDYLSTKFAHSLVGITQIPIQHHHAHIASCMAENNLAEKVIGVAFDGTGYGDDGKIWGGEFFIGDYSSFERQAHFEYIPLPGGEIGIKEPWRMAVSYLLQNYEEDLVPDKLPFLNQIGTDKINIVIQQIKKQINAPLTSSVGRLFDAVSSLIGLCNVIEYEGQAAIRLEKNAWIDKDYLYPYEIIYRNSGYQISVQQLILALVEDIGKGRDISQVSGAFHRTVASITLDVCLLLREKSAINNVVLSGGVFQNRILLGLTLDNLEKNGFHVYTHSKVPANDGGISLGQAAIALRKYMEMGMQ
ncbi:MAG TPA: carbamoyltransferase HypF [Clostridia bacterium]|nr:carbamoyltransferase HypF [Clostridia bacterium]